MTKHLKIGSLLLIVTAMLTFTSCDSDDDKDPSGESLIVGTWTYESSTVDIKVDDVDLIEYLIDVLELGEEEAEDLELEWQEDFDLGIESWEFEADGTFTYEADEETATGTWSLSNDGKTLTITESGESQSAEVETLTSGVLELYISDSFDEDLNEDGTDEELSIEVTIKLEK